MQLTINIPDAIATELQEAIAAFNARAARESGSPINLTAPEFLRRELKGCLKNFILAERHRSLQEEAEALIAAEADRLRAALP